MILEVPVFFSDETKPMKVEVQLRTIAMDFWASIEHKIRYKKDVRNHVSLIEQELCRCAEELHAVDLKMQYIGEKVEEEKNKELGGNER